MDGTLSNEIARPPARELLALKYQLPPAISQVKLLSKNNVCLKVPHLRQSQTGIDTKLRKAHNVQRFVPDRLGLGRCTHMPHAQVSAPDWTNYTLPPCMPDTSMWPCRSCRPKYTHKRRLASPAQYSSSMHICTEQKRHSSIGATQSVPYAIGMQGHDTVVNVDPLKKNQGSGLNRTSTDRRITTQNRDMKRGCNNSTNLFSVVV
jgi:hypothetical protein